MWSQRWDEKGHGLMASKAVPIGASRFVPEGVLSGTCLWSWFVWNRGLSGLGSPALPLCQPNLPFYGRVGRGELQA